MNKEITISSAEGGFIIRKLVKSEMEEGKFEYANVPVEAGGDTIETNEKVLNKLKEYLVE